MGVDQPGKCGERDGQVQKVVGLGSSDKGRGCSVSDRGDSGQGGCGHVWVGGVRDRWARMQRGTAE